ncbi:MAG TPA: DUF4149 domain-containing protein [Terriglobales bacterium]|nr:DUF4149 domain-containing protein [Terriglobales bacterium]
MRSLRIIAIALWLGAIVYFAAAVAPNVFAVLTPQIGGRALAGDIVNHALALLHYFGFGCALIFLLLGMRRLTSAGNAFVLVMLVLTGVSQFVIMPRMHALRARGIEALAPDDPARKTFDFLHKLSTTTEGVILLLGIGTLVIESRRD